MMPIWSMTSTKTYVSHHRSSAASWLDTQIEIHPNITEQDWWCTEILWTRLQEIFINCASLRVWSDHSIPMCWAYHVQYPLVALSLSPYYNIWLYKITYSETVLKELLFTRSPIQFLHAPDICGIVIITLQRSWVIPRTKWRILLRDLPPNWSTFMVCLVFFRE